MWIVCPPSPLPAVLDGFRIFEHSQYWPMDPNLVVGTSRFMGCERPSLAVLIDRVGPVLRIESKTCDVHVVDDFLGALVAQDPHRFRSTVETGGPPQCTLPFSLEVLDVSPAAACRGFRHLRSAPLAWHSGSRTAIDRGF